MKASIEVWHYEPEFNQMETVEAYNDGEWPVVKIVNTKTGEVFYLTRHDPS